MTSQCIAPSVSRSPWSCCLTIFDASLKWIPFAFRASRNYSPTSLLLGDLFLHETGLCFQTYWRRIAAVAAAAAAAFRGGRGYPYRGGNGFPMHAWRFNLRFDIVRISWALPVIYHGMCRWSETHIIELVFLRAQRGTVVHDVRVVTINFIHKSFVTTTYQNPYGVSWWTQWWYLPGTSITAAIPIF